MGFLNVFSSHTICYKPSDALGGGITSKGLSVAESKTERKIALADSHTRGNWCDNFIQRYGNIFILLNA